MRQLKIMLFILLQLSMVLSAHTEAKRLLNFEISKVPKKNKHYSIQNSRGVVRSHKQSLLSLGLYNNNDGAYIMTNLSMSSNKKKVPVAVDSGSPWIYIMDYDCGTEGGLSEDCKRGSDWDTYSYLDGSVSGKHTRVSLWLSDDTVESVNHLVLVATEYQDIMKTGIVGMSKGYGEGQETFLRTLQNNGLISDHSFSISYFENKLEMIIGGIDQSKILSGSKEVVVPILSENSYHIYLDIVQIGGFIPIHNKIVALFDSGNTLISLPESSKDRIVEYLGSLGIECYLQVEENPNFSYLVCSLSTNLHFPTLTFYIGGVPFEVPEVDLIDSCETEDYEFYMDGDDVKKKCDINIEFQSGGSYVTIGKTFIEKNYITFDLDHQQLTVVQNPK